MELLFEVLVNPMDNHDDDGFVHIADRVDKTLETRLVLVKEDTMC